MKDFILAYNIEDRRYLNVTNRCTNNCAFCIRKTDVGVGYNLWLAREPGLQEIKEALGDPAGCSEVVFCGYGEPLVRLDLVKDISSYIKDSFGSVVRVNTNGHADLLHGRGSVERLRGLVDRINISLNAENDHKYREICRPSFGPGTHDAVIQFAASCVGVIPDITLSVVDWPGIDIVKCREIAENIGVAFRVRKHDGIRQA
ncbi:MAG: radical SAM protein [Peptococcaceae bacterium BICA1-7]|nr:MAG: radical SAM protein [Peptococcaceae bacterium BICA1-7]